MSAATVATVAETVGANGNANANLKLMTYWSGVLCAEFRASSGKQTLHLLKAGEAAYQYVLVRTKGMGHPLKDALDSVKTKYTEETGDTMPCRPYDLIRHYWAYRLVGRPEVTDEGIVATAAWVGLADCGIAYAGFRVFAQLIESEGLNFRLKTEALENGELVQAAWAKFLSDRPKWPVRAMKEYVEKEILGILSDESSDDEDESSDEEESSDSAAKVDLKDWVPHCRELAKRLAPDQIANLAFVMLSNSPEPDTALEKVLVKLAACKEFCTSSRRALEAAVLTMKRRKPEWSKAEEPKAEEPKAKKAKRKPKAEEPKAEEPKAEEPKAEEPKAEEPKAEEPKAEEPKAEEPKAEEPKAEEPKAEEQVTSQAKAVAKVA